MFKQVAAAPDMVPELLSALDTTSRLILFGLIERRLQGKQVHNLNFLNRYETVVNPGLKGRKYFIIYFCLDMLNNTQALVIRNSIAYVCQVCVKFGRFDDVIVD